MPIRHCLPGARARVLWRRRLARALPFDNIRFWPSTAAERQWTNDGKAFHSSRSKTKVSSVLLSSHSSRTDGRSKPTRSGCRPRRLRAAKADVCEVRASPSVSTPYLFGGGALGEMLNRMRLSSDAPRRRRAAVALRATRWGERQRRLGRLGAAIGAA
jgi:hypothetical protein